MPLVRSGVAGLGRVLINSLTPIPVEISSSDVASYMPPAYTDIAPVTDIQALEGAGNLGILLWAFVLYQGIFTTAGRPADWLLNVFGLLPGVKEALWYRDFKAGFAHTVPPAVEAGRVAFFLVLGFYVCGLTTSAFDGDAYWGWAIPGSLTIPVGLLALVRGSERKITRTMAEFQEQMTLDFDAFFAERITRNQDPTVTAAGQRLVIKTPERAIISQFRRSNEKYRDEAAVPDKIIRKVIRSKVGYKPDQEGDYRYIEMQNLARQAQRKLEENLKRAREARALVAEELEKREDDNAATSFDNEFVRRQ